MERRRGKENGFAILKPRRVIFNHKKSNRICGKPWDSDGTVELQGNYQYKLNIDITVRYGTVRYGMYSEKPAG